MLDHPILFGLLRSLLPASILLTAYLYTYPFINGCAFPSPRDFATNNGAPTTCIFEDNLFAKADERVSKPAIAPLERAPFRLLALGDPQLEGDSSLPQLYLPRWSDVYSNAREARFLDAFNGLRDGAGDIPKLALNSLKYARKAIDLLGNDYYLAHIYRSMMLFTQPTHVTVLGDLLGSQWISDEEFESRTWRYWNRVFKGAQQVPRELLSAGKDETKVAGVNIEVLGSDSTWRKRLINIVGNHDIGYAGDINSQRIERFERAYGPVNGDIRFTLNFTTVSGDTPVLRLLILNSMNLDGPAFEDDLKHQTYEFVNSAIFSSLPVESHHHATILLTHIPLHKASGICVDEPFFDFYEDKYGGGVKEQNMLSADHSRDAILQGLFGKSANVQAPARGLGRDGIILTGHDHEGCEVYHYVDRESGDWKAARWLTADAAVKSMNNDIPGLREVTVRSMMGDFGGNAALVSGWWDGEAGRWRIEVNNCPLGTQHLWWAVHILDLVVLLLLVACVVLFVKELFAGQSRLEPQSGEEQTANGSLDTKTGGGGKSQVSIASAGVRSRKT
jgi:hypothetical protein